MGFYLLKDHSAQGVLVNRVFLQLCTSLKSCCLSCSVFTILHRSSLPRNASVVISGLWVRWKQLCLENVESPRKNDRIFVCILHPRIFVFYLGFKGGKPWPGIGLGTMSSVTLGAVSAAWSWKDTWWTQHNRPAPICISFLQKGFGYDILLQHLSTWTSPTMALFQIRLGPAAQRRRSPVAPSWPWRISPTWPWSRPCRRCRRPQGNPRGPWRSLVKCLAISSLSLPFGAKTAIFICQ